MRQHTKEKAYRTSGMDYDGNRDRNSIPRRSYLSAVGGSLLGSAGYSGIGAANKPDIYEQAVKLREKTGSQEKFLQFLRNHNSTTDTTRSVYQVEKPVKGNDEVSSQQLSRAELDLWITLTYHYPDCSSLKIYSDIYWTWTATSGFGEDGLDVVQLSWNDDHYRIEPSSYYSDNMTSKFDSRSNGIVFEFYDKFISYNSINNTYSGYAGVQMNELATNQERYVYGKYSHTYQQNELQGFSVSSGGGVSLSWSIVDHKWNSDLEDVTYSERDITGNCFH